MTQGIDSKSGKSLSEILAQGGSWVTVMGQSAPDLEAASEASVQSRVSSGEYKLDRLEYVRDVKFKLIEDRALKTNKERLQKLRALAQLWDIDIRSTKITSHRPLVGPVIVGIKRLIFPVLKVFLKDTLRQQRDFNAATISLMAELCSDEDTAS